MQIQKRNSEMVSLLSGDFRRLYEPAHAFADAVSMIMCLPGLRGFWPMSVAGASSGARDLTGIGLNLTNNSTAVYGAESLIPYAEYDGTADYHSRATESAFEIIGNEAHIQSGMRGVTLGGWFYTDLADTTQRVIGKGETAAADIAYVVNKTSDNRFRATVSNGSSNFSATSSASTTDNWYFLLLRYTPSTEIALWVNNTKYENTTSIPSTLNNPSRDFTVGAAHGGANFFDGKASLCFLTASALPDVFIDTIFNFTAPLFGARL